MTVISAVLLIRRNGGRIRKNTRGYNMKDEFTRLVDNLVTGELGLIHIQIAVRTYVRRSKHISDDIKDLLAGRSDTEAGLIFKHFQLIEHIIGNIELAYRRGCQAGEERERQTKKIKRAKVAAKAARDIPPGE